MSEIVFAHFCLKIYWKVAPHVVVINYCPRGSNGLYCFRPSFFSVSTITHEPLPAAWWNFAGTCISTTARNPKNFKVIGQSSRSHGYLVFFYVHDAAATRGQYLALSKAWWSCFFCFICRSFPRCSLSLSESTWISSYHPRWQTGMIYLADFYITTLVSVFF